MAGTNGKFMSGALAGRDEDLAPCLATDLTDLNVTASSGVSTRGTTSTEAEDELHDGCVVLGLDAGRGNRYCTRYHIDREQQKEMLSLGEVLSRSCCPCCLREKQTSCPRSTWQFIRAEAFLVSLHVTVILLGVMKEALNLRDIAEELHLMHSILETVVTVLIVTIRLVSAWYNFKQLKRLRNKVEHVDVTKGLKTRSRVLKTVLKLYTFVCIFMILFAVIAFALFYTLVHLGWTILSNNFALILVMACDALLRDRMAVESNLVKSDHKKAVIYEMSLLLEESTTAPEGPTRQQVRKRVEKFQRALRDTDELAQPDYIYIPDDYKPQFNELNMLKTMQVVSMV